MDLRQLKLDTCSVWMLAMTANAACGRGASEGARHAELPRPGVAEQELAVLDRDYSFHAPKCTRTAAEIVDMQRKCSEARWADCLYAAHMYVGGCGVARDLGQAEALYRRSCDFGSTMGCVMYAIFTKDMDRSVALLEKACIDGWSYACQTLGTQLVRRGKDRDVERAAKLLDEACREDRRHCSDFGELVIQRKIETRFADTRAQLAGACKERHIESCYLLATALEQGTLGIVDYNRAAPLNLATCHEYSHLPSCHAVAQSLVHGLGCELNPELGVKYFREACERGYAPSCHRMGQATETGWNGPASPASALPFYDRGCELGFDHSCQRAKELRAAAADPTDPAGS